jgi:hypothetical protein
MMGRLVLKCPSCSGNLTISRLGCPNCTISIEGEFSVPPLLKLTPAQLDFVEVFIKNRGVIRDVERELGVSYPTVRARLDEVIDALGYQSRTEAAEGSVRETAAARRRAVLAEVKAGRIDPERALAALRQTKLPRK